MRLMQIDGGKAGRQVVASERGKSWIVARHRTVYDIAQRAIAHRTTMSKVVHAAGGRRAAHPEQLELATQYLLKAIEEVQKNERTTN